MVALSRFLFEFRIGRSDSFLSNIALPLFDSFLFSPYGQQSKWCPISHWCYSPSGQQSCCCARVSYSLFAGSCFDFSLIAAFLFLTLHCAFFNSFQRQAASTKINTRGSLICSTCYNKPKDKVFVGREKHDATTKWITPSSVIRMCARSSTRTATHAIQLWSWAAAVPIRSVWIPVTNLDGAAQLVSFSILINNSNIPISL